jgi:hypothetical protein
MEMKYEKDLNEHKRQYETNLNAACCKALTFDHGWRCSP